MRHAKIKTKRKTIKSYETRLAYVEEIIKARNAQKGKKAQPMSRVWKDCENRKKQIQSKPRYYRRIQYYYF